jgi:hypothetical protein
MPNADNWPNYSLGPKEHLHAMGVLIAAWTHVETAYQALLQLVFPQHIKAGNRRAPRSSAIESVARSSTDSTDRGC